MMTGFPIQGGCHCGAVRYTLLAPAIAVQHCHCSLCRKRYGVLSAQGAVIARASLDIHDQRNLADYVGSPGYHTQFCRTCGCHLFATEESERTLMYLMAATLDDGKHPGHPANKECHIFVASKAEWDRISDGLPQFAEASPDEIVTAIQRTSS